MEAQRDTTQTRTYGNAPSWDIQAARRRCYEIEARLIACRCGWVKSDEMQMHRLRSELKSLADATGDNHPALQALLRARPGTS